MRYGGRRARERLRPIYWKSEGSSSGGKKLRRPHRRHAVNAAATPPSPVVATAGSTTVTLCRRRRRRSLRVPFCRGFGYTYLYLYPGITGWSVWLGTRNWCCRTYVKRFCIFCFSRVISMRHKTPRQHFRTNDFFSIFFFISFSLCWTAEHIFNFEFSRRILFGIFRSIEIKSSTICSLL